MEEVLRDSENKSDCYPYLAKKMTEIAKSQDHLQVSTTNENVISNREVPDLEMLQPCSQEEADTRVFLHLKHAVAHGHKKALIKTSDTDIVVLAIYHYHELQSMGLEEL